MNPLRGIVWIAAIMVACVACASCNTMRGMGKDIERAGEKIQQKAR